jgi:hypothetical protein
MPKETTPRIYPSTCQWIHMKKKARQMAGLSPLKKIVQRNGAEVRSRIHA